MRTPLSVTSTSRCESEKSEATSTITTGGNEGVQLRLRTGIPVLIGSKHPRELEAAVRVGIEGAART